MTADEVAATLDEISVLVGDILKAGERAGGWAGHDADAKRAAEIGVRLLGAGWRVGLYGREVEEMGDDVDVTVTWGPQT